MICVDRRRLLSAAGAALAWPSRLLAQQRAPEMPLIGYLSVGNPEPALGYFKQGLRKLGYTEGANLRIEVRSAQDKGDRLSGLAAELVALEVKVLVTALQPATLAAKQVAGAIPIVMAGVADPLGAGIIASLSRPGANVTGIAGMPGQVSGKALELVRDALPSAKRVAVLVNLEDPFNKTFLAGMEEAGRRTMMRIAPVLIRAESDLESSFEELTKDRPDAVVVQPSLPLRHVAQLALKHRLASFSPFGTFTGAGGLMSYSADLRDVYETAAVYVDRILKGAKPGDLPVQQPTRYLTSINLQTAKALGLTIPKSLLMRADQLIE